MPTETSHYSSPLGDLYLTFSDDRLIELAYETESPGQFSAPLAQGVFRDWLDRYFEFGESEATPPLTIRGTDFQRKVWQAMLDIPAGSTRSYGEVATLIGSAPRAVGQACKRNHIPIVIPCHRIVASQSIGGYEGSVKGYRLDRKRWLLEHEKKPYQ